MTESSVLFRTQNIFKNYSYLQRSQFLTQPWRKTFFMLILNMCNMLFLNPKIKIGGVGVIVEHKFMHVLENLTNCTI